MHRSTMRASHQHAPGAPSPPALLVRRAGPSRSQPTAFRQQRRAVRGLRLEGGSLPSRRSARRFRRRPAVPGLTRRGRPAGGPMRRLLLSAQGPKSRFGPRRPARDRATRSGAGHGGVWLTRAPPAFFLVFRNDGTNHSTHRCAADCGRCVKVLDGSLAPRRRAPRQLRPTPMATCAPVLQNRCPEPPRLHTDRWASRCCGPEVQAATPQRTRFLQQYSAAVSQISRTRCYHTLYMSHRSRARCRRTTRWTPPPDVARVGLSSGRSTIDRVRLSYAHRYSPRVALGRYALRIGRCGRWMSRDSLRAHQPLGWPSSPRPTDGHALVDGGGRARPTPTRLRRRRLLPAAPRELAAGRAHRHAIESAALATSRHRLASLGQHYGVLKQHTDYRR